MIVTIDGPAGSGKSTAARGLAARLGFEFLDTGAMYRVVGWKCLRDGVDLTETDAVAGIADRVRIAFDRQRVLADGEDVTDQIRGTEVTQAASVVAANAGVRRVLDQLQRRMAQGRNVVTEGRDQGTVVFPEAECKFYFTADARERARRRQIELAEQGADVPLQELVEQIRDRDLRDAGRDVAPLKCAPDALRIDTSHRSPEQVLEQLEAVVRRRLGKSGADK